MISPLSPASRVNLLLCVVCTAASGAALAYSFVLVDAWRATVWFTVFFACLGLLGRSLVQSGVVPARFGETMIIGYAAVMLAVVAVYLVRFAV